MREELRLSSGRVKRCRWNERRAQAVGGRVKRCGRNERRTQAEQWTSKEVWAE